MRVPIITINVENEMDDIDYVLSKLLSDSDECKLYKEKIMKTHKPHTIIDILRKVIEIKDFKIYQNNVVYMARILRDLKKLESPLLPYIPPYQYFKFKHNRHWTDITVWDVEYEYLTLLMCQGKTSNFAPSDKYTVREVIVMLNALLDVDVIYNFKQVDVFDKDTDWDDYFKSTKRIRVQKL